VASADFPVCPPSSWSKYSRRRRLHEVQASSLRRGPAHEESYCRVVWSRKSDAEYMN
jgi:hypothetical protein